MTSHVHDWRLIEPINTPVYHRACACGRVECISKHAWRYCAAASSISDAVTDGSVS